MMMAGVSTLIDNNAQFSESAAKYVDSLRLEGNYFVVSILGAQGSGKSTLLNYLFGTQFPVLNSLRGRRQTTKGISLSANPAVKTIVLDVEGSDSRERSEAGEAPDGKFALLSVAASDAIILNLWFHDIGRFEGANLSLLSSAIEGYLKLISESSAPTKKHLTVVIRDHDDETSPLGVLQDTLQEDLKKVWQGISKPPMFASSALADLFTLSFFSLPSLKYKKAVFEQQVDLLKSRFTESASPQYVFQDLENRTPAVPASKLASHLKETWAKIQTSKELNAPSEKDLGAMYKCDEAVQEAYKTVSPQITRFRNQVQAGEFIPEFGKKAADVLDNALKDYDSKASAFAGSAAFDRKRAELQKMITLECQGFFQSLVIQLRDNTLHRIRGLVATVMPLTGSRQQPDLQRLIEQAEGYFNATCKAATLKDSDWSFENEKAELKQGMNDVIEERRKAIASMPAHNVKRGWIIAPNVDFNCTFSLLTAVNLGPKQNVGLPLGEDQDTGAPNSVYTTPDGEPGMDFDKIDMSGEPAKTRLAPFR